jgi:hypothetical protein
MTRSLDKKYGSNLGAAVVIAVIYSGLLAGCGTTPLVLKAADPRINFALYESLAIQSTTSGVVVSNAAQTRIKDLIKTEILECCPNRFKSVSLDSAETHDLLLNVKLTVYEEGNRFARFMLAGLGSMQIHAQVEIIDPKTGNLLSAGEAGKTFAWGGVYGAATGIEDLEKGFAEEVVQGLTETLGMTGSASP